MEVIMAMFPSRFLFFSFCDGQELPTGYCVSSEQEDVVGV